MRVRKHPTVTLALSIAGTATALGIREARVAEAVNAGHLIARMCGVQKRIAVFGAGGIQEWVETWPRAKRK